MEAAGTVVELGENVEGFAPGDRVAAYCLSRGSYAEYAVVPAWRVTKVPDAVSLPIATVLMLQGSTAHYLTHSTFPLQTGHTCLIHAGAGGVGQLLIQLAKLRSACVIATIGTAEKAAIAKARGGDHAILYRETNFRQAVMDITAGRGVGFVYDSVGKDTIPDSIRSLKRCGLCVNYGPARDRRQLSNPCSSRRPVRCILPRRISLTTPPALRKCAGERLICSMRRQKEVSRDH
jgi:NADPH2:quinone reductase